MAKHITPTPSVKRSSTDEIFRRAAVLGVSFTLAATFTAHGGDILRGGAVAAARPGGKGGVVANPVRIDQAQVNARDALARTTAAIQATKAMQQAARNLAIKGPNHLTIKGQPLPSVPNGLAIGGLRVAPGVPVNLAAPTADENPALWNGAQLPRQAAANNKTVVTVEQTKPQALLTWQTFNIGKETTLVFDQSAGGKNKSDWIAFNKVLDPSGVPSQILGSIEAPGQVYVINQNGIIFGGSSQVNVRSLVASTLPINENLITRGLLNNPGAQFLFSALPVPASEKDPVGFTPEESLREDGRQGDVIVQQGARISSRVSADGNGGRVMLVGANVSNSGTISTPAGQTILAAGLQVGVDAHKASDPSLRGLDVYVGKIAKPDENSYAGSVTNNGIISVDRGNASLSGKSIRQLGTVDSSTTVSLNGRIDLNANYGAISNPVYEAAVPANGNPFLFKFSGQIELGIGSVTQILPELDNLDTAVGLELALRSKINLQGSTIHLAKNAAVFAPNAQVSLRAGAWHVAGTDQRPVATFISSAGQVYLDAGAFINVAGSTGASALLTDNILSLELRGAELAPSPLQRDGLLRGPTLTVDLRNHGVFGEREWIGTPLGDINAFANLVMRDVGQLTAAGGTVEISAGKSVVLQPGSSIDVSGGWVRYKGGMVNTTRLLSGGQLLDIADATPDRIYDGIFTGTSTFSHAKYGITETFALPLAPTGTHFEDSYIHGMDAGRIAITAPAMALDGQLLGATTSGPRQLRASSVSSMMPKGASLELSFRAQEAVAPNYVTTFPSPPQIVFSDGAFQPLAKPFALTSSGEAIDLDERRKSKMFLSPDLLTEGGFASLTINNEDGNVFVPANVTLATGPHGAISISAANIDVQGRILSPGGKLTFKTFNISPYDAAIIASSADPQLPDANAGRGIFTLGANGSLNAAGLISDERFGSGGNPLAPHGGEISITAFSANLAAGSVIDVSGGVIATPDGKFHYGNGGSIVIKTGQDAGLLSLLGGGLQLESTLRGFSGAGGGSLSIQTPRIQIGGNSADPRTFLVSPEFFSIGGFNSFSLTGLGVAGDDATPELLVSPGTVITPVVKGLLAVPHAGPDSELTLRVIEYPEGMRPPVSVQLSAPGVTDSFTGGLVNRGDVVLGRGSVIRTEPLAKIGVSGSTVAILGSILAPAGEITVSGANSSNVFGGTPTEAQTTTYLGPDSLLSTAGAVVLTPDLFGRRIGYVLPGGTINVSGNIVAAAGSILDVSGTGAVLDFHPAQAYPLASYTISGASGVTEPLAAGQSVAVRQDSNAGTITLRGGQMLFTDATLKGNAGGITALGGALSISSGRFYAAGETPLPFDSNLIVTQSGPTIANQLPVGANAIGKAVEGKAGKGYFAVSSFANGGFDSLALNGVVDFQGSVNIVGRGAVQVADGGVLYADADVRISAPYVALGMAFPSPGRPDEVISPFQQGSLPFNFSPNSGTGRLIVEADQIDLGTLSLQNVGKASLNAINGDIRGAGVVNIAGDLELRAAQLYPATASDLTIVAYDHASGEVTTPGSITIKQSGHGTFPLTAGGTLNIYASSITQAGTLRAPFGTINLGWDGTGEAPVDSLTGTKLPFPVTNALTLSRGSVTSVSAIDPATGLGVAIPYGVSPDGNTWIDPRGVDITASGGPAKSINLSGENIAMKAGASIDLRGGGDLYAYRWVEGDGGPLDVLASQGAFAILPGYQSGLSPFAPYNTSTGEKNQIAGFGPGYVNSGLKAGDRIYLQASDSLPAGYYTLLPARYALLPGGVLVTPRSGLPVGTFETAEGASFVAGYQFNGLDQARTPGNLASWFEVTPSSVLRERAQYDDYSANVFLAASASALGVKRPHLPTDSGYLSFQATQSMSLLGNVDSASITGGRGSSIDISTPGDIVVTNGGAGENPGAVTLNAKALNRFGAESLLIGGKRVDGADGTTVVVQSGNVMVDNAGSPLRAPDLTLVAKDTLTLAAGSEIRSTGSLANRADTFHLSGDGLLVRVSEDVNAQVLRTNVTPNGPQSLTVGDGAKLSGGSLILDSTASTSLDPNAVLSARAYTLSSGLISLVVGDASATPVTTGLVLPAEMLGKFEGALSLALQSYSSIDIYGTGVAGSDALNRLTLSAGEIRGFDQGEGTVTIAARNVLLSNNANVAAVPGSIRDGRTLQIDAEIIRLGANKLAISRFGEVVLNASERLTSVASGELSVQNKLTAITPVLIGAAGVTRQITAGDAITLSLPGDISGSISGGGLGSSLEIRGASIAANTNIVLPSGSVTLRATTGDISIGGQIAVGGTKQSFGSVTKFTDAGEVRLVADVGNVSLDEAGTISVAADAGGGNAGLLSVEVVNGAFTSTGTLLGQRGAGGRNGSFELVAETLPTLTGLSDSLTAAALTESQTVRVRTGDVLIDGTTKAHTFNLSADQGAITVTGLIDASGRTGGAISLSASGSVILEDGALLTVAAKDFSNAGKGGEVHLEAGAQRDGIVGTGSVEIRTGSTIDLSVESKIAGNAVTPGSSAYQGQFSGTLHLRAPQNVSFTDVNVAAISGTIIDPSSIVVEGYRLYDLTASGGTITTAVQTNIKNQAQAFLGTVSAPSANYAAMFDRLLANTPENAGLRSVLVLAPGAEIVNRTGNLTLGTASSNTTSDWDLSSYRFGATGAPGVLTLRAAGNLTFYNALSDGFTPTLANTNTDWLRLARLSNQSATLPINAQSYSFRLVAGADLSAADFEQVRSIEELGTNAGFLQLGKNNSGNGNNASNSNGTNNAPGSNAVTSLATTNRYQVIRTGSGDIDVRTGRSVQLLNHFASIYTAGTRVTNPTLDGTFDVPVQNQAGGDLALGANQQPAPYPALYSMAGGSVTIHAQQNVEHLTLQGGQLVADSQRELPNNWLYRRGYVDRATGEFGVGRFNDVASTTWWVDFSNFFQGVGALGGGDVTIDAGGNVSNVDAVIPTNARMAKGVPNPQKMLELGGGDLAVRAGLNLDAGVYYVERGHGTLSAGKDIVTNATRSPSTTTLTSANLVEDPHTWLPTMLFLGKGGFDVSARGDVLLGPVGNPFLLPPGINNTYWHRSYFSTYSPDSYVNVSSLGGSVTLREGATVGTIVTPLLEAWVTRQQLFATGSASFYQPWLRLAENSTLAFNTAVSLLPPTVRATAYSGDINLAGDLTLSPSPTGTIELIADSSISGLVPNGFVSLSTGNAVTWGASRINVSDASPGAIYGIATPFGYQTIGGTAGFAPTEAAFLEPIDKLFRESGGIFGAQSVLQTKLALHGPGPLHLSDTNPTRLYAGAGDISGVTLFSPKFAEIYAGRDILDVAFYIQNLKDTDTTIVSSGRDIIPYNANSALRVLANGPGNLPLNGAPLAGDIQIGGPGTLEVLAGRNLDLGTGPSNADGTGVGITAIGNARNPFLDFAGANIVAGAGIGSSRGLNESAMDFETFISGFVENAEGEKYLSELGDQLRGRSFDELAGEERNRIALEVFYLILRDAGRDFATSGNYDRGFAAIDALFGENKAFAGDILTRGRDIRTKSGGNISIFAPGGGLTLANTIIGDPLSPPGVITESGGSISIFTNDNVDIGIGRIFTLRGGNEVIWSSEGDIAAGSSPKTVQSAPPTRVVIDPQSGSVQTDLAGLATGGGIGVLATVAGIEPGDVDLIAPNGTVDAGDAGIRVSGNLTIAAVQVLNAENIQVAGTSTGTPAAPSVAAPNLAGLSAASNAAGAANSTADQTTKQSARNDGAKGEELPSIVSVEVVGYGGGGVPSAASLHNTSEPDAAVDSEEERRKKKAAEEPVPSLELPAPVR